jgi:spore coat polysaccharide biosynthesis protein SpsF (cytidylyltransferase family)
MKKIGIIIYARTSSKRLPNKVLKTIFKKSLLEIIMLRIKKKNLKKFPIVINTSKNISDDLIIKFCKKNKINFFRGSLNNVLDRTIKCCKKYNFKSFVRINADRPFIDYKMIKRMIDVYLANNYDIVTNQHPKNVPSGLACEVASTKIFHDLKNSKTSKKEKEHIFNYFYNNAKNYKIYNYKDTFYNKIKKKKLSIDTKKDFLKIENLIKKIKLKKFIDLDSKKLIEKFILK